MLYWLKKNIKFAWNQQNRISYLPKKLKLLSKQVTSTTLWTIFVPSLRVHSQEDSNLSTTTRLSFTEQFLQKNSMDCLKNMRRLSTKTKKTRRMRWNFSVIVHLLTMRFKNISKNIQQYRQLKLMIHSGLSKMKESSLVLVVIIFINVSMENLLGFSILTFALLLSYTTTPFTTLIIRS